MIWSIRPLIAIRTRLPPEEIIRRVSRHIGEGGVLDQLSAARVAEGSVGDTTFTIQYSLEGVWRESMFIVSGRIVDGALGRLVLLKYQRRPYPLMSVVFGCVGGFSVYFAQGGVKAHFEPLDWATTAVAAIAAGIVLPKLGAVPSSLVRAIGEQLSRALLGEVQ